MEMVFTLKPFLSSESSADDPVSSDWKTSIRDEIKTKVDELVIYQL